MSRSTAKKRAHGPLSYVLDSFALLAWLRDEPGADTVQELLNRAQARQTLVFASWANIAEVYYITKRRSTDKDPALTADKVIEVLENLPLHIQDISKDEAIAAARIKADHALSLADAFAAALAKAHGAYVVTGDPEFEALEEAKDVSIHWLPRKS